jgi:hypothetical protein
MTSKIKLLNINKDLTKLEDCDFSKDFVSISSEIDENGVCKHSGLIICFQEQVYYYHYDGKSVLLNEITSELSKHSSLFTKKVEIIFEDDVVTFLGHCQKLQKVGVQPKYGFIFNESYYDPKTKESFLINAEHDITTCVGFCIKVIRGFLFNNKEYLRIEDWDNIDLSTLNPVLLGYINHYLKKYADDNGIDVKDLYHKGELKRITPSELLASGFFTDLPIKKLSIDSVKPEIENFLINKKVA